MNVYLRVSRAIHDVLSGFTILDIRLPLIVGMFGATTLLISSCNPAENDWNGAQQSNTVSAYTEFIKKHPNAPHTNEARAKIDGIEWSIAKSKNTIEAYEKYRRSQMNGEHAAEAEALVCRMQDEQDWKHAKETNTVDAVNGYLMYHESGNHASEAAALREVLMEEDEYQRTAKSDDPAEYLKFMKKYPKAQRLKVISAYVEPYFSQSFQNWWQGSGSGIEISDGPDVVTKGGFQRVGQGKWSIGIDVKDHPELSGSVEFSRALKLGFCSEINSIVQLAKADNIRLVIDNERKCLVAVWRSMLTTK